MKVFGTDGIRGLGRDLLSADLPYKLGRGLGRKKVVVGRDVRTSSPAIEKRLLAGLLSAGAEVVTTGVVPTPALSYAVANEGADYGVMITASHNPPEFNGLKVFGREGEKLSSDEECDIDEKTARGVESARAERGRVVVKDDYSGAYARHVLSKFRDLDLSGEKIVVDCACGCMTIVPPILERLGATVRAINAEQSGERVNVSCGALHANDFAATLADDELGLSFDGDGDRLIAVYKGKPYDGDKILCALAESERACGNLNPPIVVGTIMTGSEIERVFKDKGVTLLRTDVGDKHVSEKMKETGAILGGEKSGHIIQKRLAPTGDGLLTALSLLKAKKILGELPYVKSNEFQDFSFFSPNPAAEFENECFLHALDEICAEIGERGRLIARPSGTEPTVRITIEVYEQGLECRKIVESILFRKNLQKW